MVDGVGWVGFAWAGKADAMHLLSCLAFLGWAFFFCFVWMVVVFSSISGS